MEIVINKDLESTAERLAEERGMSVEAYVTKYVESHLLSQYRQYLITKIQVQGAGDLIAMEQAITPVAEAITARKISEMPEPPFEVG